MFSDITEVQVTKVIRFLAKEKSVLPFPTEFSPPADPGIFANRILLVAERTLSDVHVGRPKQSEEPQIPHLEAS